MKSSKILLLVLVLLSVSVASIYLLDNLFYKNRDIVFRYPWKNALFPNEFTSPTFSWNDTDNPSQSWKISFYLNGKNNFYTDSVSRSEWIPDVSLWDSLKKNSEFRDIRVTVKRKNSRKGIFLKNRAELTFRISEDSVGAPILYREIPLPFTFAEKNMQYMSFSACDVGDSSGSYEVLSKFLVCGNCHSLSQDGRKIALDFDASTRDKGGYFIADVDSQIVFSKENYLSWSELLGKSTFGMLSKISFDGKYVVTSVKDRAISEKFDEYDKMAYSQLFFPVNGVLSVYNIETGEFKELPGANDLNYVQTNAIWMPDGKNLIFARSEALPYDKEKHVWDKIDRAIIDQFVKGEREFKYDLYIIPFNDGKGGIAKPVKGASNNGKSNYFPAISPDGKWLIFCQAENFMMLQPDSKLFITNLESGETRELESNLPSMNSWHAWSPNGKWIVYSSKLLSKYTDLYLTHIDEDGHASTPVLIEKARKNNRALNYPEFVNRDPKKHFEMIYDYVNIFHIHNAMYNKDYEKAEILLNEYLAQAQIGTPEELEQVAAILKFFGREKEAAEYLEKNAVLKGEYYQKVN